ncbi:MAG: hypothetical protein NC187_00585 [Candidatus Amulumruptor caecigallinarius]|nr:hypothetical protein [Candidatus Amulumruptor caecigallinarius]MCM1395972.1 hypothetical protein [Candidatus Amulumruptor caecigallinarius]MCM1453004.1 hypothetical protein [bacterium]
MKTRTFLFTLVILAICAGANAYDKIPTLLDIQQKYTKKADNLNGPVYIVVTQSVTPVYEMGKKIRTDISTQDSTVFDENGYYQFKWEPMTRRHYTVTPDSVTISHEKRDDVTSDHYYNKEYRLINEYDDKGRLVSHDTYVNGVLEKRQMFTYTATGYEGKYYLRDKRDPKNFEKNGNQFKYFPYVYTLNANGLPAKRVEYTPLLPIKVATYYKYDDKGNLINQWDETTARNILSGKTSKHNDKASRSTLVYVYDEHGNWIEKRSKYADGKINEAYTRRIITYKTPEEILAEKQAEQERIQLFERNLQKKGEEFAAKYAAEKKTRFKNHLVSSAALYIDKSKPIAAFTADADKYSFSFTDGESVRDIIFSLKDTDRQGCDNMMSPDLHVVLVPQYTSQGPKWYVVKYDSTITFDFNPNDSTDWVKPYRDKFGNKENVSEDEIHRMWESKLDRLWKDSKAYLITQQYSVDKNSVCVNEIVGAYERGFVSPSIANKERESKSLDDYRRYLEDEHRKKLCSIALLACTFNEKGKPEAEKIKQFSFDETGYHFKKKDKTELNGITFNTRMTHHPIPHGTVYLSSDEAVAIVETFHQVERHIFVVELTGESVSSVNYLNPKETSNFVFPYALTHVYSEGIFR